MKPKLVIYRLWHNKSAAGRVGYIGKDTNYPKRVNLVRRKKEVGCPKLYRAFKKYPLSEWNVENLIQRIKVIIVQTVGMGERGQARLLKPDRN